MSEKNRNGDQWTESRFRSFIISALRNASMRWGPKNECKKSARVEKGIYKCACCGENVRVTRVVNGKRKQNVFVDHIDPVVDPIEGFRTWDEYIERLFCELDGLQLLCYDCHEEKTKAEKELRKKHKLKGENK